MNLLIHDIEKKVEGGFEIQFACEISKLVSGRTVVVLFIFCSSFIQ